MVGRRGTHPGSPEWCGQECGLGVRLPGFESWLLPMSSAALVESLSKLNCSPVKWEQYFLNLISQANAGIVLTLTRNYSKHFVYSSSCNPYTLVQLILLLVPLFHCEGERSGNSSKDPGQSQKANPSCLLPKPPGGGTRMNCCEVLSP